MPTYLTIVHALSPLHAGTGQGVGVIDLPIARERATGLPYLPGSSLKGTLRDVCPANERAMLFGSEKGANSLHAGAVQFADQRLLLLPVRSLAGTFAWVTAPYLLQRLARDAKDCGLTSIPAVPQPAIDVCYAGAAIMLAGGKQVVLEDLDLSVLVDKPVEQPARAESTAQAEGGPQAEQADTTGQPDQPAQAPPPEPTEQVIDAWASFIGKKVFPGDADWQAMLAQRICIVHDDVLSFLLNTATEVIARISMLDDKKTVSDGGLWYEEALPAETVLAGIALVGRSLDGQTKSADDVYSVLHGLTDKTTQFGGKATVGRGLCRIQVVPQLTKVSEVGNGN